MSSAKQVANYVTNDIVNTLGSIVSAAGPASISLATLSATKNGFKVSGTAYSYTGSSTGSVDLNGDGFSDVIIGAPGDILGATKGAAYVVYGKSGNFADTSITKANFKFSAASGVSVGKSVNGAGDVNGDGIGDLIVGATSSIFGDNNGEAYVIYGKAGGVASINLPAGGALAANQGFRIFGGGVKTLGYSVNSAGDINGDGFDDLMVGAAGTLANLVKGTAYFVFGKAGQTNVDLSNLAGKGFKFTGAKDGDATGLSVSKAGDINRDGYDDIIVGSAFADANGISSGASYVVFGKAGGFANMTTADLNGTKGFSVTGAAEASYLGFTVSSAGDFNGDGFSDLVVGASYTDSAYVVFGKAGGFSSKLSVSSLNGTNGFKVSGDLFSFFGRVSSAGDVNGDGYDDIIFGQANPLVTPATSAGAAYVLFGKAGGFKNITTADFNGVNGFKLTGAAIGDLAGISVSAAGDINGDGYDDMMVGATGVGGNVGASYVVFGKDFNGVVNYKGTSGKDTLTGTTAANTFNGGLNDDIIIGNGGADSLLGGKGNDTLRVSDLNFRIADGGTGNDTLALVAKSLNFNLATERGHVFGIETINITGTGNNILTVNPRDVLGLSDTTNTLRVLGNAGDKVSGISSAGGWVHDADVGGFQQYHNGQAIVLVGSSVDVGFV